MTKSSYQRGRSFTEPSLNKWVLREGSNDRRWIAANREAFVSNRVDQSALGLETQGVDSMIADSTYKVNQVFDALEQTRTLSSFTNTENAAEAECGDGLVASNETESADGEFDNYGGLNTGDTF